MAISIACVYGAEETDWKDHWIAAVNSCEEKNYTQAEIYFDKAIQLLEAEKDNDHSHVYVDRARLCLLEKKYDKSLQDLDKALSSGNLSEKDRERALVSSIVAKSHLQMNAEVLSDLKKFGETYAPKIEYTTDKIYIRNAPTSECFKKFMFCYFIHSGICKSKENIRIMNSGIWLIEKKSDCECQEQQNEEKKCDACGQELSILQFPCCGNDACKMWCDANTITATAWCTKVFKAPHCQEACLAAVYLIQQGCYICCEGGNFYQKCLKPFGRITDYIQAQCDPYWD